MDLPASQRLVIPAEVAASRRSGYGDGAAAKATGHTNACQLISFGLSATGLSTETATDRRDGDTGVSGFWLLLTAKLTATPIPAHSGGHLYGSEQTITQPSLHQHDCQKGLGK